MATGEVVEQSVYPVRFFDHCLRGAVRVRVSIRHPAQMTEQFCAAGNYLHAILWIARLVPFDAVRIRGPQSANEIARDRLADSFFLFAVAVHILGRKFILTFVGGMKSEEKQTTPESSHDFEDAWTDWG